MIPLSQVDSRQFSFQGGSSRRVYWDVNLAASRAGVSWVV